MDKLAIQVVSDVVCPWCFIGHRRLQQAVAALDVDADITFLPFLLDPTTPPEGEDLRERLRRKYGGDPDQMFGRVEQAAASSGIALDFSKVRRSCSTVDAHTLLRHALAKGTQKALADALFTAYFQAGRDIGARAELREIAAPHGFTAEAVDALLDREEERTRTRAEAAELAAQGISGVPFFIFGGKLAVSGAQPPEVMRSAIEQALQRGAAP